MKNLMTLNKTRHSRNDVENLYVKRKEEECCLTSVDDWVTLA